MRLELEGWEKGVREANNAKTIVAGGDNIMVDNNQCRMRETRKQQ
jgi:hypothetical protein